MQRFSKLSVWKACQSGYFVLLTTPFARLVCFGWPGASRCPVNAKDARLFQEEKRAKMENPNPPAHWSYFPIRCFFSKKKPKKFLIRNFHSRTVRRKRRTPIRPSPPPQKMERIFLVFPAAEKCHVWEIRNYLSGQRGEKRPWKIPERRNLALFLNFYFSIPVEWM